MADYTKTSISIINSFLWSELINNNILSENDYRPDGFTSTIVPIIPTQEVPEINNLIPEATFIVYDFEVEGYSDDWWICEETAMYTIVSPNYSKIIEIIQFMVDLFRRVDITGQEVQEYNTSQSILKFYTVSINNSSSPTPFESEGGRMSATVEISYKYSRILGDQGRFS